MMQKQIFVLLIVLVLQTTVSIHLSTTNDVTCPYPYELNAEKTKCICPYKAYLTKENRCFICESPNYWHQQKQQCYSCPPNGWWQPTKNSCQICPDGFIRVNKTCQCPQQRPYMTKQKKCVVCARSSWDFSQQICRNTCAYGQIYDLKNGKCVCPAQTPYFTPQNMCVACIAPEYWNQFSQACQKCPVLYHYSPIIKNCLSCPVGQTFDSVKFQCKCPIDFPYFSIEAKCIRCDFPNTWIARTRRCQANKS